MQPETKTKLWVNKEIRSDGFEPALWVDFVICDSILLT